MRSEVEPPRVSHSSSGRPTSERITSGEILSELPEITTPVRFWPKFLENRTAVKDSRGKDPWLPLSFPPQGREGNEMILPHEFSYQLNLYKFKTRPLDL